LEDIFERDETGRIHSTGSLTTAMCMVLELISRMNIDEEGETHYFSPFIYHTLKIKNITKRAK
jgi:hypothetical protein